MRDNIDKSLTEDVVGTEVDVVEGKESKESEAMLNKDSREGIRKDARPNAGSHLAREPPMRSDRTIIVQEQEQGTKALSSILRTITTLSSNTSPSSSIDPRQPQLFAHVSPTGTISVTSPLSLSSSLSLPSSLSLQQQRQQRYRSPCRDPSSEMPVATTFPPIFSHPSSSQNFKTPPQYLSSSSIISSSLQTVRHVSGQRGLLAQRPKTSFSRLLDSVTNNTAVMAESRLKSYYNFDNGQTAVTNALSLPQKAEVPNQSTAFFTGPLMAARSDSKPKFFVCDDDSEEELEDEFETLTLSPRASQSPPAAISLRQSMDGCLDRCDMGEFKNPGYSHQGASTCNMVETTTPPSLRHIPTSEMPRRQSLLSSLFKTEKHSATQHGSNNSIPTINNKNLKDTRLYHHSASKSNGEDPELSPIYQPSLNSTINSAALHSLSHFSVGITHQYRPIQRNHHRHLTDQEERVFLIDNDMTIATRRLANHEKMSTSALKRTKKSVFRKLDELAIGNERESSIVKVEEVEAEEENEGEQAGRNIITSLPRFSPEQRYPLQHLLSKEKSITLKSARSSNCTITSTSVTLPSLEYQIIPESISKPSLLSSSFQTQSNHKKALRPALLPSFQTCYCTRSTATATTTFTTASAASKCSTTTALSPASVSVSASSLGGNGDVSANAKGAKFLSSKSRVYNVQAQIHSFYGHLSSGIQRAIATAFEI
ncbi:hypothetical protein BX616_004731 [Lobosporangium transversale]|nr:hypothetical protein BX616_004731 [Lobosporangium transversale]